MYLRSIRGHALATVLWLASCCVALPTVAADAPGRPSAGAGYAVVIGGALSPDNDAVWSRIVKLAGGPGARFVVLATASDSPESSAARIIANLERRGAVAGHVAVAPRLPGIDVEREVANPKWIEMVRRARGVYFAGGAQERIVDTLLPGGKPTPLLEAIRELYRSGGVVAGSSAGAAIMGDAMIRDVPDVLDALKGRLRTGTEIDRGLGFVGPGLVTDQHFLQRGRIGRLLPVLVKTGSHWGLGIEENTAAVVHGQDVEVIGAGGAMFVDLSGAKSDAALGAFNLAGARLSYVDHGDRLDLGSGGVTPAADKLAGTRIDWTAPDFESQMESAPRHFDLRGSWSIVYAMADLVDSRQPEVRGLVFDERPRADDPLAALGFEFRLYKGPGTAAWYSDAGGADDYTIADVYLDVTPVRVAQPLYTPWKPR